MTQDRGPSDGAVDFDFDEETRDSMDPHNSDANLIGRSIVLVTMVLVSTVAVVIMLLVSDAAVKRERDTNLENEQLRQQIEQLQEQIEQFKDPNSTEDLDESEGITPPEEPDIAAIPETTAREPIKVVEGAIAWSDESLWVPLDPDFDQIKTDTAENLLFQFIRIPVCDFEQVASLATQLIFDGFNGSEIPLLSYTKEGPFLVFQINADYWEGSGDHFISWLNSNWQPGCGYST